jgi:hypothetical protein
MNTDAGLLQGRNRRPPGITASMSRPMASSSSWLNRESLSMVLTRSIVAALLNAVRWYLRYGLSYRDVEELLAERSIEVDHVTVYGDPRTPTVLALAHRARQRPGRIRAVALGDLRLRRQRPDGGQHRPRTGADLTGTVPDEHLLEQIRRHLRVPEHHRQPIPKGRGYVVPRMLLRSPPRHHNSSAELVDLRMVRSAAQP